MQANNRQLSHIVRKLGFLVFIPVLVFSILPTTARAQAPTCDTEFYSLNDITFYNPCSNDSCSAVNAGGALTSKGPSSLTGDTNEAKTWNYFIARGLTPVAAAGAMGNISHESSFSASVEEASGGGGLGIIQWTGDRRTKLEQAAATANVNLADNDAALLFELDYLWDGETGGAMMWQEQVNAEESVEGDPYKGSFWGSYNNQRIDPQVGNGSTLAFHALIERSGDVPTEAERIPGHGVLQGRIDTAKEILAKYDDGTAARGSCDYTSAGGLTWEQSVALAKKLVDNWSSVYCGSGSVKNGQYCNLTDGYCTAGAAWMAVTTAPDPVKVPGIPNGVDVASTIIASYPEVYTTVNPDGSNLQPFSIWSFGAGGVDGQPGHTGTVVGVSPEGKIITLETNWSGQTAGATNSFLYNPGHKVAVFEYPSFEAFKNSRGSYKFNNLSTPRDSATATAMGAKMAQFMGN